jgi:protein-disulfide isomerase
MKKVCALLFGVWALSLPAHAATFTPDQTKEIGEIVRSYLIEHPEVLIEAQQALQNKQLKESEEAARAFLKDNGDIIFNGDHYFIGAKDGDAVFVEFFDYNCGYCKLAFHELLKATKEDAKIKIILIDTPILGPSSELAARWALAAGKLGKYKEFHQAAMEFKGPKDEKTLTKLVGKIGLDPKKVKDMAMTSEVEQQLVANMKIFFDMKRNSTPTFFSRDHLVQEQLTADLIKKMALELRANAVVPQ